MKRTPKRQCAIRRLTLVEIIQKLKVGMKPVMVQFKADWCGACQATAPEIGAAACDIEKLDDIELVQVDVDEHPMVAAEYGVENLPTVLIVQHGQVKAKFEGSNTASYYRKVARDWLKENGYKG